MVIAKKELSNMTDEEIHTWLEKTAKTNTLRQSQKFPYKYNPDNLTEAYLEDAEKKRYHK